MVTAPSGKRQAQGALEYLITYGWAILIIVIIGGALFALGVFNPSSWTTNKRATGFTTMQIKDWVLQGGTGNNTLIAVLQNKAGYPVYVWRIKTTDEWGNCDTVFSNVQVQEDDTIRFIVACLTGNVQVGKQYTLNLQIQYESNGLNHTDFGTLSGKAE